jgi:kynurenine formamidase
MPRTRLVFVLTVLLAAGLCLSALCQAPKKGQDQEENSETPIGPKWWPSKWGPEDQRGAANLLTPDKVREAKDCIKEGKVYQLGRLYEHGMPIPGKRHFSLTIPGLPTGKPSGENQLVHNDELVSGEIGQVGTQFDGLGHIGVHTAGEDVFYNGNKLSDFGDTYGLTRLGVENAGPFFTRGILLDVAGLKGVRSLPAGHGISAEDLAACLRETRLTIRPGDVVLIRTGHGALWMTDNEAYGKGEPGITLGAARWLTERQIALVGSDNWAVEVVPHENPDRPFEVHQWLLVRNGTYLLENLDLDELAKNKVYEFAFVFSPLRLKGATGSPGNPIAVR